MSKATSGSGTVRGGNPGRTAPRKATERAARTQEFLRGLASEMRRVTWPSREEWIAATLLTIGLVAVIALYTYVLDITFGWLFSLVHH